MLDPHDVRRYAPIEYDEMPGEMILAEAYDRLLAQWQSQRDTITKLLAEREMLYVRNLHDAFGLLHDAAMRVPQMKEFDHEEMLKIRPNPVQQSQLDSIDALLQRLAKLQLTVLAFDRGSVRRFAV
jgi:hypothetical protein